MKKRNFRYLLISVCLTISLMLVKKWNLLEDVKDSFNLRNLFEEKVKKYACDKAGSRLTNKYKDGYNEKDLKKKNLSKAQRSIVDFARDSSYKNIKPYIKKLGIFIFFLVLDIIFIFLWISYCSCCCCSCCLFSTAKPSKICSCVFFSIAAICNILVIIFSIAALGLISPFFKRINGFACSTFNFLDHARYGLAPSYVNNQKEWEGINGIINILNNSEEQKMNIIEIVDNITITQDYKNGNCGREFIELENIKNHTQNLIDDSFKELEFKDEIADLEDAQRTFDDADKDIGDDVYDALHDYINKHAKRVFKLIFSLTLIFGILGLAFLCLYFFLKNNVFRIIYVVIWNISMLLMLLVILIGVVFGIVGHIFRDSVQVGQYILSPENLKSEDPLLLDSKDEYVSDLIEICANGDGDFMKLIQENGQLKENIENWENDQESYQNKINSIDNLSCGNEEKKELKENYEKFLDVANIGLNISQKITNVKCRFARNDKNIILNEVDSAGKKGISLCALSLLVGILLGISVLAGIIFVHKYKYNSSTVENNDKMNFGSTTNINESTENIGKENANNITKNNNMNYPNNNEVVNNNMNL